MHLRLNLDREKLIYHIGKELNENNNIKSNHMFIKKEINLCAKGSRFINSKCEVCPNKNNVKTYEQNSCVVKECNTRNTPFQNPEEKLTFFYPVIKNVILEMHPSNIREKKVTPQ